MRLVCLTKEEVAKEVANRILNLVEKKPDCILGLATGSTPIETYNEIIKGSKAGGIDFQILGIGSDGHIAFNEPGTPFDSKTHIADLKEETIRDNSRFFKSIDDVPTQAVTMGLSTIMKSKEIVLLAFGKNKAKAIKAMFDKPSIDCPASILSSHPDVTVYCDEDAKELLK